MNNQSMKKVTQLDFNMAKLFLSEHNHHEIYTNDIDIDELVNHMVENCDIKFTIVDE